MPDIENLEKLNNVELRAKMKEFGLPNFPVTDTSRSVIIKKLHAAMGLAAKKSGRRETIAAAASPAKTTQPSATNRRTIAATDNSATTAEKITSRRRSVNAPPQSVAPTVPEITQVPDRRRSVRESSLTKSNVEAARRVSTIVLDSDDEEDVVAAAEKFEKQLQEEPATTRRSTSRAPSLTRTAVVVSTYNQNLAPLQEEESTSFVEEQTALKLQEVKKQQADLRAQQQQLKLQQLKHKQAELIEQQKQQQQFKLQQIKQQQEQQEQQQQAHEAHIAELRAIANEAQFKAAKPLATSTMANYSSQYSSGIYPRLETVDKYIRQSSAYAKVIPGYNEFSDDGGETVHNEEEQIDSPFLSNFARNLKRLQAEPLRASPGGDLTRRFARSRTAQEVSGRIALPRSYAYANEHHGFMYKLGKLNDKHNLLRHGFLLLIFIFVFYVSYKMWQ